MGVFDECPINVKLIPRIRTASPRVIFIFSSSLKIANNASGTPARAEPGLTLVDNASLTPGSNNNFTYYGESRKVNQNAQITLCGTGVQPWVRRGHEYQLRLRHYRGPARVFPEDARPASKSPRLCSTPEPGISIQRRPRGPRPPCSKQRIWADWSASTPISECTFAETCRSAQENNSRGPESVVVRLDWTACRKTQADCDRRIIQEWAVQPAMCQVEKSTPSANLTEFVTKRAWTTPRWLGTIDSVRMELSRKII